MNTEEVYAMCMGFQHAVDCFPFDDTTLVFTVGKKMFAVLPLEKPHLLIVKCDPERAIDLRERYHEVDAAWHFNKKHWNQLDITGNLSTSFIREQVTHSYELVVKKLPRKVKDELNIL